MSDPFETTARLAQQRGQGIEQGFGTLGQGMMGAAQGMQTQKMLKDFGLITDTPPSLEDYQKEFEKQTKTKITGVRGIEGKQVDPNTMQGVNAIFDFMGLKKPESRGVTFDAQKAAQFGAIYKPDMFGGQVAFSPKQQTKSLFDQITEANIAKQSGLDYAGGKVKTPSSVSGATPERAQKIGDAIISGKQPPELTRLYGAAAPVRAYLADKGFDLTKAQIDWTATSNYVKNLNSTQQVRLGQALSSVKSSVEPLRKLSEEFTRTNLTPANWVQLQLAMKTGDPTATKMVTQINLMRDELAQAFMAGGVPTERALELVKEILQPVFGGTQMDSALDQLNFNLNIRENAINTMRPRTIGGELETGRPMSPVKGLTDAAGLTSNIDESKVQVYMKKYPNKSREDIIRAMGR